MENNLYYKEQQHEVEVFTHAFQKKLPMLLKGPTGSGKSRFVEFMADKIGKELFTVACHEETSATDLIGRYLIKGTETVWVDGPMTRAVKEGAILYLDEIAEARPDIIVALHSLSDYRRSLYLDKTGETIRAEDGFMLVASFNPGYQKGFKELKPSTRQRFISLSFKYPSPEIEVEIIQNETGIEKKKAGNIVRLAGQIRNLTELGLAETASTRLLVDAAHLMNSGLASRLAAEVAIAEPLSDDSDTLEALKDLISLNF